MDSILSNVVLLKEALILEDHSGIPSGAAGHVITPEYLKRSSFSPDDFSELLASANLAKAQGFLYVDFQTHGKCARVHPNQVL